MTHDVRVPQAAAPPTSGIPPTLGRRVTARLIDWSIGMVVYATGLVGVVALPGAGGLLLLVLLFGGWTVAYWVSIAAAAATPGQRLLGLVTVDAVWGHPTGSRAALKNLLLGVAGGLTFGALPVVAACFLRGPWRRSWFDAWAGTVVCFRGQQPTRGTARAEPRVAAAPPVVPGPAGARVPEPQPRPTPTPTPTPTPPETPTPPQTPTPLETPTPTTGTPPEWARPVGAPSEPARAASPPAAKEAVDDESFATATVVPGASRLVLLDDGRQRALEGPLVLGRNPAAPRGYEHADLMPITDHGSPVSKSHVLLDVVDGDVVAVDLHSTNGTRVVEAHGPRSLEPGVVTLLKGPVRLDLGGVVVQVLG